MAVLARIAPVRRPFLELKGQDSSLCSGSRSATTARVGRADSVGGDLAEALRSMLQCDAREGMCVDGEG